MSNSTEEKIATKISKDKFRESVLEDYRLAYVSRETSYLGRREVLTGKAKWNGGKLLLINKPFY
mgnify:CR=1 FL=1